MRSLEAIIVMNARAAGREMGHADSDGNDALAEAIHKAATEHPAETVMSDEALAALTDDDIDRMLDERESAPYHAADLNDETYVEFTTGYLAARKES